MKIALPTSEDGQVEAHFGHCSGFTIYSIEEGAIAAEEKIIPPPGCGCKSSIIPDLAAKGVSIMLAGNMGPGAAHLIVNNGMDLYRGVSGDAKSCVQQFLAGQVSDHDLGCGSDGHSCGNH